MDHRFPFSCRSGACLLLPRLCWSTLSARRNGGDPARNRDRPSRSPADRKVSLVDSREVIGAYSARFERRALGRLTANPGFRYSRFRSEVAFFLTEKSRLGSGL